MSKFFMLFFAFLLALALVACSGEKADQAQTEEQPQAEVSTVATEMVKCTGCDMEMEKAKMIAYESEGETLYFCSEECKTNYLANLETGEAKTQPPDEE